MLVIMTFIELKYSVQTAKLNNKHSIQKIEAGEFNLDSPFENDNLQASEEYNQGFNRKIKDQLSKSSLCK